MTQDHNQKPEDQDPETSKSARKREADRLQELGRQISQLNPQQIEQLALSPELHQAIQDYQRFPSYGAKRRQLQFVGKLMRKTDTEHIESQLALLDGESAAARYQFHQLESWRDELLSDGEAVTRYIADHPKVDRQKLRHLIKKARAAGDPTQQKAAARQLFRFLRDNLETDITP